MKHSLKKWKELAAEKRAAWMKAKAKGIKGEELAALKLTYTKYQAVVDEAEADGGKDEDEVSVSKKVAAELEVKSNAEAEDDDAADDDAEPTIDLKQLTQVIVEGVTTEFKKHLKTDAEREQVTAEGIKEIISEVLKDHVKKGDKAVAVAAVKDIMAEVMDEQRKAISKKSKMRFSPEDPDNKNDGDESQAEYEAKAMKRYNLEIPISGCKGNLPLHQKQLLNRLMGKHQDEGIDKKDLLLGAKLGEKILNRYSQMARAGQKALTSTGSGTGDEWVPTDFSSELLRRMYLASPLNAIMAGAEIQMPSEPYIFPLSTTRPTFYGQPTENTGTTASTPATAQVSLASKKFMSQVDFSYEVDEDSIVPILPTLQTLIAEAGADAFEDCLINGDTTGTHQDSDTNAVTNAAAKQFKGFRLLALAVAALKSDISSGGLNEANLRALVKLLGKWGVRTTDLIWIVGARGINDIKGVANISTADKTGSPATATILTGEVATFLGIPIITSERNREDLNASGVYDGTTTTKGSILLVNKSQFITGRRREFTVETFRDIILQKNSIVASFRRGMVPMETPATGIKTLSIGYNYTS